MNNKILIVVVLLILGGVFYFVLFKIIGNTFSTEPRKPKLEIAETSDIGWWASQEALIIDKFQVEFVESQLNLFNNKSLIKYTVTGKLSNKGNWKPSIKNIHVSQRFLKQDGKRLDIDTMKIPEAMIEITPVIEVTNDEDYSGEEIEFEFTNELKLESFHWGNNSVRFQCADKWQDLILKQRK